MQDKLNARLMGVKPTGNGRRESYAHLPMPRMTNTYMLAGQSKFDDLVGFRGSRYLCTALRWWASGYHPQVNLCSQLLKLISLKKVKLRNRLKGATLIGSGIDVDAKFP